MATDGTLAVLPCMLLSLLCCQLHCLACFLGGIVHMPRIPAVLFIVAPRMQCIAVQVPQCQHIPIVAMVALNTDPAAIAELIPSNEAAIRAVR